MFLKVIRDIAKPQWFGIITLLKRSTGMSVAELAAELGMSYMGVKQHCVELEKRGYLDTWRRPKEVGRPEKAYRLTSKADPLFPEVGADFALEMLKSVAALNGQAAAEKLLFAHLQGIEKRYAAKIGDGTLPERVAALAKLRDAEGCLSTCEQNTDGLQLVENHSPFTPLLEDFPSLAHMEEQMLARLLGASVTCSQESASALVRRVFTITK